jgi:hypothetical protein
MSKSIPSTESLPVARAVPSFDASNPMGYAMSRFQNMTPDEMARAKELANKAAETGSGAMKAASKQAANAQVNLSDTMFRWTGGLIGTKKVTVDPYLYHKIGAGLLVLFLAYNYMSKKKTGAPGDEDKEKKPSQLYVWLRNTLISNWNFVKALTNDLNALTKGKLALILVTLLLLGAMIIYQYYPKLFGGSTPVPARASYKSYYAPRQCRYKMK